MSTGQVWERGRVDLNGDDTDFDQKLFLQLNEEYRERPVIVSPATIS